MSIIARNVSPVFSIVFIFCKSDGADNLYKIQERMQFFLNVFTEFNDIRYLSLQ